MTEQKKNEKQKRVDKKRNREWSIQRQMKRIKKTKHQLHMMRLTMGEH